MIPGLEPLCLSAIAPDAMSADDCREYRRRILAEHIRLLFAMNEPQQPAAGSPPPASESGTAAVPSPAGTEPPSIRWLTGHKAFPGSNELNDNLNIAVLDQPGPISGANHDYEVAVVGDNSKCPPLRIRFQNDPVKEVGMNGVSNEALLAVLIDRMEGFQRGKFKCRENAVVLTHLETAQLWLGKRTRDRIARGVEGKNER